MRGKRSRTRSRDVLVLRGVISDDDAAIHSNDSIVRRLAEGATHSPHVVSAKHSKRTHSLRHFCFVYFVWGRVILPGGPWGPWFGTTFLVVVLIIILSSGTPVKIKNKSLFLGDFLGTLSFKSARELHAPQTKIFSGLQVVVPHAV